MTKVLIVADVRRVRQEFRDLCRGRGIEVLEPCSVEDAPAQVAALRPDAILVELATARPPNVIDRIKALHPNGTIRLVEPEIEAGSLASALTDLLDGHAPRTTNEPKEVKRRLTPRELQVARRVAEVKRIKKSRTFWGSLSAPSSPTSTRSFRS